MALTPQHIERRFEYAERALYTALDIIDDMLRVGSTTLFKLQKEESRAAGIKELDQAMTNARASLENLKTFRPR
jgi:hypothetical protein